MGGKGADQFSDLRELGVKPKERDRNQVGLTPANANRLRRGLPMQDDRVLDLLRNPPKPPRDPYTCVQDYDPFADEPSYFDDDLD